MKVTSFAIFLFLMFFSANTLVAVECDEPTAQESVRIYFANGMSNTPKHARDSKKELQKILEMPDKDFGLSYNDNENWLLQLLHVYKQRENSSDDFWYWLRNMSEAPKWFHDEYVQKVGRFNENMVRNDPDLTRHINKYLADLNSGKKVVIVAHSQGNFYANNAYRYIKLNYPHYKDSIGIVSVATPATWVEGGGTYSINNVYTTNPEDLIIQLVEAFYSDTLNPNVPAYDNPNSMTDHGFIDTYLTGFRGRIVSQINNRTSSLSTPQKDFECMEPEEVPVNVITNSATNITKSSARLNGKVLSGKQIAGYCIYRKASSGDLATCRSYRNNIPTSGSLDTDEVFYCNISNLSENETYNFRVCGREGERISDGGQKSFIAKDPDISSRNAKICVIDVNSILDDNFDLYLNEEYVGPVRNVVGGSTCYNTTFISGMNTIYLKLVKTNGKSTYLELNINDGEYVQFFGGSQDHTYSVTAP